jgi:hypothetical protein
MSEARPSCEWNMKFLTHLFYLVEVKSAMVVVLVVEELLSYFCYYLLCQSAFDLFCFILHEGCDIQDDLFSFCLYTHLMFSCEGEFSTLFHLVLPGDLE